MAKLLIFFKFSTQRIHECLHMNCTYHFALYFNPTNTSESTINAIEYAVNNAQYGEVMSARYPINIAAPE